MRAARVDPTWEGGVWGERATAVLCPNPSPMTLEGTNTWVLAEPGSSLAVVVDPGPLDESHLQAVLDHVAGTGRRVALTLLTHHHDDHAEAADRWARLTGAAVRGMGRGHDDLGAGERLVVGGLEVLVVPTPGHTADSTSFLLPAEQVLLTGDTILGRGTTVVAYPDGDLTSYLESLDRLAGLTRSGRATTIAPGHGPGLPDAEATVRAYQEHRSARLAQVAEAVDRLREADVRGPGMVGTDGREVDGDALAERVVADVYADVPRAVWPAARLSVLAQLAHLGVSGPGDAAARGPAG